MDTRMRNFMKQVEQLMGELKRNQRVERYPDILKV